MLAGQTLERINSDNSRTPPPVDYALASACHPARQGASGLSAESNVRQAVLYPRDRYRLTP
jgi:hypothetical protein